MTNSLKRIIRHMAKLRDVRDLVNLAKTTGDDNVTGYRNESKLHHITDYDYYKQLPNKHFIVALYASKFCNGDKNKALDIYGDATSNELNFIDEKNSDQRVYVTSAGRSLLEVGWWQFPKGILYAWMNYHKLLTNLIWIIIGVIVSVIINLGIHFIWHL